MGIRLVYGLQTGDASYLDIFHPSRRLKEAALADGLDYAAMIHRPGDMAGQILDFCTDGQYRHVALLRGELPDSLYCQLEAAGLEVINPAAAVALARDKLASAAFFSSIGARHPRTVLLNVLHEPVVLPLALPFVVKPRFGKMGRGVALIQSGDEWSRYLAQAKGQETIAQEFIGTSTGRDIRFFFADFKAGPDDCAQAGNWSGPGWVCVMRRAPGFLSNAHAGGSMEAFSPPEELHGEAQRIFTASGLVYGTVDFLFSNDDGSRFVVCELNANPGFEELERAMNIDVASAIIARVKRTAGTCESVKSGALKTPGSGKDGTA